MIKLRVETGDISDDCNIWALELVANKESKSVQFSLLVPPWNNPNPPSKTVEATPKSWLGRFWKNISPFETEIKRVTHIFGRTDDVGDTLRAELSYINWIPFVHEISRRRPKYWQSHDVLFRGGPMGQPDIHEIMQYIRTTAVYQLLLAITDMAERLNITYVDEEVVGAVKYLWTVRSPSQLGKFGLQFVPDNFFKTALVDDKIVYELLQHNRLGKYTISNSAGEEYSNYYVPYATPITNDISKEAGRAYSLIRCLRY